MTYDYEHAVSYEYIKLKKSDKIEFTDEIETELRKMPEVMKRQEKKDYQVVTSKHKLLQISQCF